MAKTLWLCLTACLLPGYFGALCAAPMAVTGETVMVTPPTSAIAEPAGKIFVIPIDGPIEKALIYVLRRGLAQAEHENAVGVVFEMNTPGGRLDAADEIVRLLLATSIPTCTLVNPRALSAGAIIAMATDRIYMTPGGVIGDAMPIMITPFGGTQEMPEPMQEKAVSAVSAMIRSAAQRKGHDPQLAEAMVRREIEYKIGEQIISPAGQLLTLTDTEAARPAGEDRPYLLSRGTVADLDELLERQKWQTAETVTLRVSMAERIARVIESFSVILLAAGLLGLYIEFKTPGFGLPGTLGVICLAVFFWGHHIAGLAGMGELLIFMLGIALLLVEIFFIPGFGVVGLTGLMMVLFAFFSAMTPSLPEISWTGIAAGRLQAPLLKAAGAVLLSGLGAWLLGAHLPHSPLLRRITLNIAADRASGYSAAPDSGQLLGATGRALTALRPSGMGGFGGRRLDVVTRGEYLAEGAPLQIVEARGARIVVEAADGADRTG